MKYSYNEIKKSFEDKGYELLTPEDEITAVMEDTIIDTIQYLI